MSGRGMEAVRTMATLVPLVVAAACSPLGTVCTLEARPGVLITVLDNETGEAVASSVVHLTARDGSYADSLAVSPTAASRAVGLAYERRGTYTVSVAAEGYEAWSQEGVRVREGECHVGTEALTARLEGV